MFVFDDGIVVGQAGRLSGAGVAFGLVGGLVTGLTKQRQARKTTDAVLAMQGSSAEAAASQVRRAQLFRTGEVSQTPDACVVHQALHLLFGDRVRNILAP
jgi:hypothetical protein